MIVWYDMSNVNDANVNVTVIAIVIVIDNFSRSVLCYILLYHLFCYTLFYVTVMSCEQRSKPLADGILISWLR